MRASEVNRGGFGLVIPEERVCAVSRASPKDVADQSPAVRRGRDHKEVRIIMQNVTRSIAGTALALLAIGCSATAAHAAPAIPVNNGQETTGAEGGAHGKFSYTIDGDQFCYTLDVTGLTTGAVAAHVHVGDQGVAGPVRIPLTVPNETSFMVDGCTTVTDPAILMGIQENPRGWYVNVHTPTYPGGEVRGQLK